jgi:signal transduction histidine kinase/CheY-like chemotaxis protein
MMTPAWVQVGVPVAAAALQMACALHVATRLSRAPGAKAFAAVLACEAWWAAGYVFELIAEGVPAKVFWDNVQLPPAFLLPLAFLLFVADYTGQRPSRLGWLVGALMAPPLAATLWVFTDAWHGAARATARILPAPPFDSLTYDFSGIELFSYFEMVLIMAGLSLWLFVHAYRHKALYRRQAFVVWLGSVFGLIAELPGLGLGIEAEVLGQRDSSPVWFGLSGVLITLGLRRFRLFDVAPMARDAVFENMADVAFVIDAQQRLVAANPAARRLLAPEELVLGQSVALALGSWPALLNALEAPANTSPEFESPDGGIVFELRGAELSEKGLSCGRAIVLHDVTARKRANAELERRVMERTADLYAQMEATRSAHSAKTKLEAQLHAAQRLESIGRLAGGVAHDFNNLLTVILGSAQLARKFSRGNEDLARYLGGIEQAASSAAQLTGQLLAFARQHTVEVRTIQLNRIVENTLPLIERLVGEDVQVKLALDPGLFTTRIDPTFAEQVLVNLVVNARDAMPRGGGLFIGTHNVHLDPPRQDASGKRVHAGDYVMLSVRDEGTGMSPEIVAHVFEPFFTTKGVGSGTGLGLSMVYGTVQRARGFIEVDSHEGTGTEFRIFLPRNTAETSSETARTSLPPRAHGETVALVEDQPLVLATVKTQLEGLGYQVRAFASAEEARAGLLQRLPEIDVLLTDVVLAGENGRELAERLRAERPSLRVVFMSGYTDDVVIRHGLARGEVWLLEKPFTLLQLARMMRIALDADNAAAS